MVRNNMRVGEDTVACDDGAGAAAAVAVKENATTKDIDIKKVQKILGKVFGE